MTEAPIHKESATTSGVHPAAIVHHTAEVHTSARVGPRTRIWHQVQVGEGVEIGADCVLGKGVYVASAAVIGDRVKIQNGCGVFGARLEQEVMLAPGVYLLEDPAPRAVTPDGAPKGWDDWTRQPVTVRRGATVGANAVVAPGVTVGRYALIAIGSAVNRDVPDHALVAGNPARQVGWVCRCGHRLDDTLACPACWLRYDTAENGLSAVSAAT
jgi:UDP-2-acetamido-3-amino-2,3-dideoxy-glucuronate N-acetyltransferase